MWPARPEHTAHKVRACGRAMPERRSSHAKPDHPPTERPSKHKAITQPHMASKDKTHDQQARTRGHATPERTSSNARPKHENTQGLNTWPCKARMHSHTQALVTHGHEGHNTRPCTARKHAHTKALLTHGHALTLTHGHTHVRMHGHAKALKTHGHVWP